MAKVLVTEDYLTDIADAIRDKTSSEESYTPAEMAEAISDIETGITPTGTKSVTITSNGTITEDVTNYANVEIAVNVPSGSPTLITKSITENGTYAASSDSADGYSSVTVNVSSGGGDVYVGSFGRIYHDAVTIASAYSGNEAGLSSVLLGLSSQPSGVLVFYSLKEKSSYIYNQIGGMKSVMGTQIYRYRNGSWTQTNRGTVYDAAAEVGDQYDVYVFVENPPV